MFNKDQIKQIYNDYKEEMEKYSTEDLRILLRALEEKDRLMLIQRQAIRSTLTLRENQNGI